jgi:hypothetical protein
VRQAILAGSAVIVGTIFLLAASRLALGRVLDRYRFAAWQAEWLTIEPQWTSRR